MPKVSERRAGQLIRLEQLLRVVNGEYGWSELKVYFRTRYATALQLRGPEIPKQSNTIGRFTDEDYKAAEELVRKMLQRWAAAWIAHPPRRKQYDPEEYFTGSKNAKVRKEFTKLLAELPKETVLALFVPGQPSQTSSSEPAKAGRWIRRRIKHAILPAGVHSGKFATLDSYVNDVLASGQFEDPALMAKAIAVELFRALLRSGIRLGQCRLPSCNRYFMDLAGVTEFCSCQHAQAAVNQRRKQKREARVLKVIEAIKEFERMNPSGKNWKNFVARRAHVTPYWLTLLVNKKIIIAPTLVTDGK
jgi:hypothetical protein